MHAEVIKESDLFRAWWDDGLLDLFFGLGLLVIGIGWETPLGPLAVLHVPLWIALWGPLRRRLVEPRAGFVRFSQARRDRNARGLRIAWMLGLVVFALALSAALGLRGLETRAALARAVVGLPAMLLAIGACIAGALTGTRRFFVYGFALAAGASVAVLLRTGPALPIVVAGAGVTAWAIVQVTRFVRSGDAFEEQE